MDPAALMAEDTLKTAQKSIANALRHLKELEAPHVRMRAEAAGGPHRETAMGLLRNALRQVDQALAYHQAEARRQPRDDAASTPGGVGGPLGRAWGP